MLFLSCSADILVTGGQAGGGKMAPLDSIVWTPFGPKKMGDIKCGSQVSNPDGSVSRVIGVYPQGVMPIYKATCDDGASCEVGEEHLWLIKIASETRFSKREEKPTPWIVATTKQISAMILNHKRVEIPISAPVQFTIAVNGRGAESRWPIPPYTLGAMIGDGHIGTSIILTNSETHIVDRIKAEGIVPRRSKDNEHLFDTSLRPLFKKLGLLDTRAWNKFIPKSYKITPLFMRTALMQGLMDTDGYADSRGHASYTTTSEVLAQDVQWLARSLGFKANITTKQPRCRYKGKLVDGKLAYTVFIKGNKQDILFSLPRKRDRAAQLYNGGYSERTRRIVSIEYSRDAEAQCIAINHPNGLYLTDDFIVTHNTFGLMIESVRHVDKPGFTALILRQTFKQINLPGGWWDMSLQYYPLLGGVPHRQSMEWEFPSGARIQFGYLASDVDSLKYKGAQIALICFDQIEEHTENSFFYMLSRNRSMCEVPPYIRSSCNPDPDSWLRKFLDWWIDNDSGYPIPEREGVVRWMIRPQNEIEWFNTRAAAVSRFAESMARPDLKVAETAPKSVTFIPSNVYENKKLLDTNPEYLSNLLSLPEVERERLMYGNWNIKPAAGTVFSSDWFDIIDPSKVPNSGYDCRAWDFAATEKKTMKSNPDETAAVLGRYFNGQLYIMDCISVAYGPSKVDQLFLQTTYDDLEASHRQGVPYMVRWEQEPASAGKRETYRLVTTLQGLDSAGIPPMGSKLLKARPLVSQASARNVHLVRGDWNQKFRQQMHHFGIDDSRSHDDIVDATSLLYSQLVKTFGADVAMF
jgi:predicted phage terminase large subunit-like protein